MHKFFRIIMICAMLVFLGLPAQAHRLNVFAWLENDSVIVECNFGRDRPAMHAVVTVLDSVDKREVAKGETDASGRFAFRVPETVREGHGFLIDVNGGEGHHGEWSMDASELYAGASLAAGFDEAAIDAEKMGEQPAVQPPAPPAPAPVAEQAAPVQNLPLPASISHEDIRNIVNESLENRLAPIRQHLAAQNSRGPSITEIVGGIGWIMGLLGIFLYFQSRRRQSK